MIELQIKWDMREKEVIDYDGKLQTCGREWYPGIIQD